MIILQSTYISALHNGILSREIFFIYVITINYRDKCKVQGYNGTFIIPISLFLLTNSIPSTFDKIMCMLLMPPLIQNHHFFTIKVEMYLACFFYILRMRHLRTFFLNRNGQLCYKKHSISYI